MNLKDTLTKPKVETTGEIEVVAEISIPKPVAVCCDEEIEVYEDLRSLWQDEGGEG
jgi:hypothetical protein